VTGRRLDAALAAALLVLFGAYVARGGAMMSPDSVWYEDAGRALARGGFRPGALLAHARQSELPVFYFGFTYLSAAAQELFPAHWKLAIALANAAALAGTGYLALRLARAATGSTAVVLGVFAGFALLHDQFQWVRYVTTDSTFQLLALSVFSLTCAGFRADAGPARSARFAGAAALAALSVFCRPPGLVLCAWVVFVLAAAPRGPERRPPGWGRTAAVAALLCALAIGVQAFLMAKPDHMPPALRLAFDPVWRGLAAGAVVDARPETYTERGATATMLWRVAYFFAPWSRAFSTAHTVANAAVYLPVYLLGALGLRSAFAARSPLPPAARDVAVLAALFVAAFAVFHALTLLDYDWRYRLPAVPALLLLAAVGAAPHGHTEAPR
jgi:hypothetical protein